MSILQRFLHKAERLFSEFVEFEDGPRDPGLVRLEREETAVLEQLKSASLSRSSRSFMTCASVMGVGIFSIIGYLTSWTFPAIVLVVAALVATVFNSLVVHRLSRNVNDLVSRHEALCLALESRKERRLLLESNGVATNAVVALDALEVSGRSPDAVRVHQRIRDRVSRLKRERILPLGDARQRLARMLLASDREGLEVDMDETSRKLAERQTESDLEGMRILERSLAAKRDTVERLLEAERELATIDLLFESIESQVEHLNAVVVAGDPPDGEEVDHLFDLLEESLLYAPGSPERLGEREIPGLPPA